MQYDVKTPKDYLEALDDDWRKITLLKLRDLILSNGPELHEVIEYKMLGYCLGNKLTLSLNAQKNYVSLYIGDHQKIDPKHEFLKGLNVGKGCIRFSKTNKVEESLIEDFIKKTLTMARAGSDIDC